MSSLVSHPAVVDLDAATCSHGAPSARNLIVTVFGDVVVPCGADTELTVQQLTELLTGFGVNERLVRTSLSRVAGDGLLASRSEGRRSFYRVAPGALSTFRTADRRIYRGLADGWDGQWTIVVLDGNEASPDHRARLRQELAWAGLGTVAPNVLASPVVSADAVVEIVERVGGFHNVLVSRSTVVDGAGLLGQGELVRRTADLVDVEQRYAEFVERFERLDDDAIASLDETRALKLRLLLVATFRRAALADPQLPAELLPDSWAGRRARDVARWVYGSVASASDRRIGELLGRDVVTDRGRFG
jgi:phenylacetic acid degradation operon negative regulatory protein